MGQRFYLSNLRALAEKNRPPFPFPYADAFYTSAGSCERGGEGCANKIDLTALRRSMHYRLSARNDCPFPSTPSGDRSGLRRGEAIRGPSRLVSSARFALC